MRVNPTLRNIVARMAWRLPGRDTVPSRSIVVLLYHGVSLRHDQLGFNIDELERHIAFLKRHSQLVGPGSICETPVGGTTRVLLTFDDGFRNNAELVVPLLRKHRVPAVFFVTSRHAQPGKYLWFSYLRALARHFPGNGFTFRGRFWDMSEQKRAATITKLTCLLLELKPHPTGLYEAIENELPQLQDFVGEDELRDRYAGLTAEQVGEIGADPLFTIGVHTLDHPYWPRCEPAEAVRQIVENKAWLERELSRTCDQIAYPLADFTPETIYECRRLGFQAGYSIDLRFSNDDPLQIPRVGVYYPSLEELGFKIRWGLQLGSLRNFHLRMQRGGLHVRSIMTAA